jgi:hypothetical protein
VRNLTSTWSLLFLLWSSGSLALAFEPAEADGPIA